jgi:sulfatase modifying factor 1
MPVRPWSAAAAGSIVTAYAIGACRGGNNSSIPPPDDAGLDAGDSGTNGDDGGGGINVQCVDSTKCSACQVCCGEPDSMDSGMVGSACRIGPCPSGLQLCSSTAECLGGAACNTSLLSGTNLGLCVLGADGGGTVGPAGCNARGDGLASCGPSCDENCSTSLEVPGGTYDRTYSNSGDGGIAFADPATVSTFRLDKYDVTVGRFRQFVEAVLPADGGLGWLPPAGSGKHTYLNGGLGLVNVGAPVDAGTQYEPGWLASDNGNIAPTTGNLTTNCDSVGYATWTPCPGDNENLPINCVNWFEASAFCIWDDGFLPSEAEWEYAAAGGAQQLEFPWGSMAPGTTNQYAIYDCYYPSGSPSCTNVSNIAPVGTSGAGFWGQLDLAGNVWQWTLDWNAAYVDPCTDCAYLTETSARIFRGGGFSSAAPLLLPPYRGSGPPAIRLVDFGLRCARTP